MDITTDRGRVTAQLVVRFPDGEEREATMNDLVATLWKAGYAVLNFLPGNHTEVYTPHWLGEAADEWNRAGRPGGEGPRTKI